MVGLRKMKEEWKTFKWEERLLKLEKGQYILISTSTHGDDRFVGRFQWYDVMSKRLSMICVGDKENQRSYFKMCSEVNVRKLKNDGELLAAMI